MTEADHKPDSPVDARVLAYTALASVVVGLLSGMVPALQAGRASITAELKDGARQSGAASVASGWCTDQLERPV